MYQKIDKYVEDNADLDTSMDPKIGSYCLAKIDNEYNRAKIISNSCTNEIFYAKVFCCDTGLSANCAIDDIMHIPDYLINLLPFQVSKFYSSV